MLADFVKSEEQRSGLASRLASSKAQSIYKRVNILPIGTKPAGARQRLQAAQSTYEVLLRRLQEVRVAENQNIGNVRILEAALVPQSHQVVKELWL